MAIAFVATGTVVNGGVATVVTSMPAHSAGNILILCVVTKYADPGEITGWTSVGRISGGLGAVGADSGNVWTCVYTKEATSSAEPAPSVVSTNSITTRIMVYSKAANTTWSIASTTATDSTADTTLTYAGASNIGIQTGDLVLANVGLNTDAYTITAGAITTPGVVNGTSVSRVATGIINGDDLYQLIRDVFITSGTSTGVPSYTATSNANTTVAPTGSGVILRLREVAIVSSPVKRLGALGVG